MVFASPAGDLADPYVFFKTAGDVVMKESGWKTLLKVGFKPAALQQMEVGSDGQKPDFDPRCGPDVTTAGGHPFSCADNARGGECERNPGWMIMFCPNACNACDLKVNRNLRCDRARLNISSTPIYAPGDMDKMFKKCMTLSQTCVR